MIKKLPYIIAIFTMFSGILIAIMFGANEDFFKKKISNSLNQNSKISAITDVNIRKEKISKEKSKLWRYYQRFHFH